MSEISFIEPTKELNFDSMTKEDYEKSTGVKLSSVQDQTLMNVANLSPCEVEDKLTWAAQQLAVHNPRDAVENMLVQQMIALNSMMLKSSRFALMDGQTVSESDMHLKNSARLSNAFASVMTALDKHRGKGKQTIVVKYQQVNVGQGGQAVIGEVKHGEGGTGKK